MEKQQEKNNQNNNTIIPDLISYREQLKKLIKKFIFFFDVFKEKKNINKFLSIQIVFLYDFINIDKYAPNLKEIEQETEKILNESIYKLKDKGKIIFQLIFFDFYNRFKSQDEENKKLKEINENYKKDIEKKDEFIKNISEMNKKGNLNQKEIEDLIKKFFPSNNFP